ncbi:MAG: ABC transporter permease [Cyclobacteriaceae bacterium]|nr:ABC transporter permease [Cyclobacteriaceae bacterium]
MLANYLRIAFRNFRQNPVYALINIFSLAIGLAACITIFLFISDERSFDAWHSKKESIFRLNEVQNWTGTKRQLVALSGGPFGPVMITEFPEIARYTRFWGGAKRVIKLGEKQILVDQVATVDSTFLSMFDFELLHGDRATVLDEPNTMVLTEETARKFFADVESAVGQTVTKRDREFKITGILKDIPENSHLQFDALESFETYVRVDSTINTDWNGNYLVTYFQLVPNADYRKLESKFAEWFIRWTGQPDVNEKTSLYLQPFTEVHLNSSDVEHDYQNYRKFNGRYLDIFTLSGLFILLIASVNFMNLTTARASHRWKEIGVRTSVGARKQQLFGQFILESLLLAFLALALGLLIDFLLLPLLNQWIGRQLTLSPILTDPVGVGFLLAITAGLGVLTGIYPSLYMTSVNAARVLKGGTSSGRKSVFQSGLVIVQFGLAAGMMVSTGVVVQQLYFMRNKDVGFTTERMLLVELDRESNQKYQVMKDELLQNAHVLGVTASGQRLGNNFHQWGFKVKMDTGVIEMATSNVNVDPDYLTVYGMKLVEGRNFSMDNPVDDGRSFIINESLVKHLQLKNPIGAQVGHGWFHNDSLGTVIGVVSDFNFNSLHHTVNTLSIVSHRDWGHEEMTIKLDGANTEEALASVKAVWDKHVTGFPFTYTFLDQHMDELYRTERQMGTVTSIMAVLAILISAMGLFGLAMITTERRIKEVGIRKALGATEWEVTLLISSQFARLIGFGFLIVTPIVYYLLSEWLNTFAFRVNLNPLLFLGVGLVALSIGMLTISYHTLSSARANPVKALRYE